MNKCTKGVNDDTYVVPFRTEANKAINPVWILHDDKIQVDMFCNYVNNSTGPKLKCIYISVISLL